MKTRKRREKGSKFPPGWDEKRIRRVLKHYERQTEEEALLEDRAAFSRGGATVMKVPGRLVQVVRNLIALTRS
jgi:hypothetical protein